MARPAPLGRRGFIRSYGLFWSRSEVTWSPGRGNAQAFRMLGRIGKVRPGLMVADHRRQLGIYVLHNDHGPYYVGLTRIQDIGHRLRAHTQNHHSKRWDRFSWFGFRGVLKSHYADGTRKLGNMPKRLLNESDSTMGDIEALMILTLGTHDRGNVQQMRFANAQKWEQVKHDETTLYLGRIDG